MSPSPLFFEALKSPLFLGHFEMAFYEQKPPTSSRGVFLVPTPSFSFFFSFFFSLNQSQGSQIPLTCRFFCSVLFVFYLFHSLDYFFFVGFGGSLRRFLVRSSSQPRTHTDRHTSHKAPSVASSVRSSARCCTHGQAAARRPALAMRCLRSSRRREEGAAARTGSSRHTPFRAQ